MPLLGALFALQVLASPPAADIQQLVARARLARYQQDSLLLSYQAVVRQRMSGSIGVARGAGGGFSVLGAAGAIGRDRLAARFESVARVGWHRTHGAWADVIAARAVVPIVGMTEPDPAERDEDAALALPYVPGRDRLWPMDELRQAFARANDWIEHPLAAGADSLYLFHAGDSLSFRLPNGDAVWLREIQVRPRRPESRLIVGSLWVDVESGSLVRAAYRPSVPVDLWPLMRGEFDREARENIERFGPFLGIIREVVVEHGLFERRFWLPRVRMVSAEGTAKGARVSISIAQTFSYERVAAGPPASTAPISDVRDVDPRTGRVRNPRWYGIEDRTDRCRASGDSSARWSPDSLLLDRDLSVMWAGGVRFRVLVPCDARDMVHSPELPASIYSDGEELFTDTDLAALRRDAERALALPSQARWSPQPWNVRYGIGDGLARYNRIEGLSLGAGVDRVLGDGYAFAATGRLGVADLQPNADVVLTRSNVRSTVGLAAYRRLVAVNDWGAPLGLGASVNALLFARDEGFYHRALGLEVLGSHRPTPGGAMYLWRVFGERHDSAAVGTHVSAANAVNGRRFRPNIQAVPGLYAGVGGTVHYSRGVDPSGVRLTGATRAEGAVREGGDAYARLMTELTLAAGLGGRSIGTLMAAAGSSAGPLPPQRAWYLGGAHTVRGFPAGEAVGNAFWLGRAELAIGHPMVRPALFVDAGWAGAREDWSRGSSILRGAGIGVSALDGLVRLDVSRGFGAGRQPRLDLYIEVR